MRAPPSPLQDFLSSVILPFLSILLLPVSLASVVICIAKDLLAGGAGSVRVATDLAKNRKSKGTVMITGGKMAKSLALARAFKRAGWKVIGIEEAGWGEYCPLKYSSSVDSFHLLPSAVKHYQAYTNSLISLAIEHHVDLFLPVCGVASEVEDAKVADLMSTKTGGRCKTFIQDPETIAQLHDKDEFINLVDSLGFAVPKGTIVYSVEEAMTFLKKERRDENGREIGYIIKCTELDENRGDLTTYPFKGDDEEMKRTRKHFDGLKLKMSRKYPYVIQEFIPGQEWCTHASVVDGKITSFVTAPSNDMLMTYEDYTTHPIGERCEKWTSDFLARLGNKKTPSDKKRRVTGHFSFDFIISTRNGEMYPIECNPRCHTAVILLPLSDLAAVYPAPHETFSPKAILRPIPGTIPRSWLYNDLIMRYLPYAVPSTDLLSMIHPSLPACHLDWDKRNAALPEESPFKLRIDPTLIADDPMPFLVLYHVFWPQIMFKRYWQGIKWTRLNVSTGRIFEA